MSTPVAELGVEQLSGEPLALPGSKVGILDREFRERRRQALSKGPIEVGEFADQDADGPAVADDVVHGDQQEVIAGSKTDKFDPKQGTGSEMEGELSLFESKSASLGFVDYGV